MPVSMPNYGRNAGALRRIVGRHQCHREQQKRSIGQVPLVWRRCKSEETPPAVEPSELDYETVARLVASSEHPA